MRKYTLILSIIFLSTITCGQSLLFTSEFGGDKSNGALVQYDLQTSQMSTYLSLAGNFMYGYDFLLDLDNFAYAEYSNGLVKGLDGYYYGVNRYASGVYSRSGRHLGVFYRMHPTTYEMEILHSFTGYGEFALDLTYGQNAYDWDLRDPVYSVVEMSAGVFYGIALIGGAENEGGIWKYDVNTSTYSKVGDFEKNVTGIFPLSPLVKGAGDELYGTIKKKGSHSHGFVYKVNTSTDAISYVGDLDSDIAGTILHDPKGSIVYHASSNRIYGVKSKGTDVRNGGGVYYFDLSSGETHHVAGISIDEISVLGNNPNGLHQGNDGNMYFTCSHGGSYDKGTLIQFDRNFGTIAKVLDFSESPNGVGFINAGTSFIGNYNNLTTSGSALWEYHTLSSTLTNHLDVSASSPGTNLNSFLAYDNGDLIGHFMNGGPEDAGSMFSYSLGAQQTTLIQNNGSPEGRSFVGELLNMGDTTLIGYVGLGGDANGNYHSENGFLAKINIQTGAITKLEAFNPDKFHHDLKDIRPILADNGKLYFTYFTTGTHITFFFKEYDFNTNTNQTIFHKSSLYITHNEVGLIQYASNKIAFGKNDSLYVYDVSTQTFDQRKKTHDASVYGHMRGKLFMASDGKLYGTTKAIPSNPTTGHDAVLFSFDVATFTFNVEHTFNNAIRNANIGLTEYNGKLYGSTNFTGANGDGFLFSYELSSGNFTNEYDFSSATTGGGFEAEWTPVGNKLYSSSYTAGQHGFGTLVEFDPATDQLNILEHLTAENGRAFRASPIIVNIPELISITPNTGPQNSVTTTTILGSNTGFTSQPIVTLINSIDSTEVIAGIIQSVQSDTEMTIDFDIPINATPGLWDLKVGINLLENAFTITQVYPNILDIDPSTSQTGVTVNTDITGENTQWLTTPNPVVKLVNHNTPNYEIIGTNVYVVNDELITADFSIPGNAFTGNYDVYVDNLVLVNGFTVVLPNVPVLHSITPDTEMQENTVVCTIEAFYTTFTQGGIPDVSLENVQNPSDVIIGQNVTVLNDTKLEVTFDILHYSSTGLYNLFVDNLDLMDAFTVLSSGAALTIINPDYGMIGDFLTAEISATGTQFTQYGVNSVYMSYNTNPNEMINAISYYVVNDTIVEATFGFPANTSTGMWDVWVDSYYLMSGFELMDQNKYIVGIDPDSAYQGNFILMEISTAGTFFTQGLPDVYLENSDIPSEKINAIDVTVINDTLVIAEFGFPDNSTAGLYDLTVEDMTQNMAFTLLLETSVEGNLSNAIKVYPNPFEGHIMIVANHEIKQIDVYNSVGATVHSSNPMSKSTRIDTGMLIRGLYFVRVVAPDGTDIKRKIIK